ncbi:NEW3 domain-containing protein [Ruania suaedae]|uniref:golvesin C-terminal-like domain-containing protein n=1 Tax=Ruania suaedae TaxID=2897774 RepID=UPI001E639923|nr:NEW3 domain-containing protein [Ruania suaedae]UFU02863.1 NEW3 domain-containing protein [Ruania suaedae]
MDRSESRGPSRRSVLVGGGGLIGSVLLVRGQGRAHAAPQHPQEPLPDALRRLDKPGLVVSEAGGIEGNGYRIRFHKAVWDGGHTILRDIEIADDGGWRPVNDPTRRFDEQWVILRSDEPVPLDYYATADPLWVGFDSVEILDSASARLVASAGEEFEFSVVWTLTGSDPIAQVELIAGRRAQHVIGYQATDIRDRQDINEVLCGSRQHARVITTAESLGAWELFAPMSLREAGNERPLTWGVFAPAHDLAFEHERHNQRWNQAFGMSLRNDDRGVQPVMYAPQAGERAELDPGDAISTMFGVVARSEPLTRTFEYLAREQYGLTDYRENVFDTSLTQTAFNIIDLIQTSEPSTEAGGFVASPSGWWDRAKSFVDPEFDNTTKTTTAGALLGAALLTRDHSLYADRARPMMEFHVSREDHAWSPIPGTMTTGSRSYTEIGHVPRGLSAVAAMWHQTRGTAPGLYALALREANDLDATGATPMTNPLMAWKLTGDRAHLARLRAEARRYVRQWMPEPYSTNEPDNVFQYYYSKAWTEILLAYEETGDRELLEAAHVEARRFVTQTQVRPVPSGDVTVPTDDIILNQFNRWDGGRGVYDYPRTEVEDDDVPAWVVATSGLTFEQLSTYKIDGPHPGGGFSLIPMWAPYLLRLASLCDDDLLRDVAHNLVVGRWTNYPGYYNRQHIATHMKPDFPHEGPSGISAVYYNHIPAQLALTLHYLFEEVRHRSRGEIDFPGQFESNYVFFRFNTYGHEPGVVYGDTGVWPVLEPGTVTLDNAQINWVGGQSSDAYHLVLLNESQSEEEVTVRFGGRLEGTRVGRGVLRPRRGRIRADGAKSSRPVVIRNDSLTVDLTARGMAVITLEDVSDGLIHYAPERVDYRGRMGYHFDEENERGVVRAMLIPRPDFSGYDAYVQIATTSVAELDYRIGEGESHRVVPANYPNEWTVFVEPMAETFEFNIEVDGGLVYDEPVSLRLSSRITGAVPDDTLAEGEATGPASTTAGDDVDVTVRVRTASEPISPLRVDLDLPSGWSRTDGDESNTPAAGDEATWVCGVSIPADGAPGPYEIPVRVLGDEVSLDLEPWRVEVLPSVLLTAIAASPMILERPGDPVEMRCSVLNLSPVDRSVRVAIQLPVGWSAMQVEHDVEVPARQEFELVVPLTSPLGAEPGSRHQIVARLSDGSSRSVTVNVPSQETIVDNEDPWPRYRETGYWNTTGFTGSFSGTSRWSASGRLGGTARWAPQIREAGRYQVALWYPSNEETTTAATYVIRHAEGEEVLAVNQQENARAWNVIGEFNFAQGDDGWVELRVESEGYHRADAVRFVPLAHEPGGAKSLRFAATLPGEPSAGEILVSGGSAGFTGEVNLDVPAGWTVDPGLLEVEVAADGERAYEVRVTPPAGLTSAVAQEVRVREAPDVRAAVHVGDLPFEPLGPGDPRYEETGSWSNSGLADHDGGPSRYAGGTTMAAARWLPDLAEAATYDVIVWWPGPGSSTNRAVYELQTEAGLVTLTRDQGVDDGRWVSLGLFELGRQGAGLTLTAQHPGHHRAASARFVRVVPL